MYFICLLSCSCQVDGELGENENIELSIAQIDSINHLTMELWHKNIDSAIYQLSVLEKASNLIDYPKGYYQFIVHKGIKAYSNAQYDSAINYYLKARNAAKKQNFDLAYDVMGMYLSAVKQKGLQHEIALLVDSLMSISQTKLMQSPSTYMSIISYYLDQFHLEHAKKMLDQLEASSWFEATDKGNKAQFYMLLSRYLAAVGQFDKALITIDTAKLMYEQLGDHIQVAFCLYYQGKFYLQSANYKAAISSLENSWELFKELSYKKGVGLSLLEYGKTLSIITAYPDALDKLLDAELIFSQNKNIKEQVDCLAEIGTIFIKQRFYKTAEDYLVKALEISKSSEDYFSQSLLHNKLGTLYKNQKLTDQSLFHYTTSLDIARQVGYKQMEANALFNQSLIVLELGEVEDALRMQIDAYEIEIELGNKLGMAISEFKLAEIYMQRGALAKAEVMLSQSRNFLKSVGALDYLASNLIYSANLYERIGNINLANKYLHEHINIMNQLNNAQNADKIAELEARHSLREKELEIARLNLAEEKSRNELSLKEAIISNQRLFIYFAIAVVLFSIGFLIMSYRLLKMRSKSNRALEQLNTQINDKKLELETRTKELEDANEEITILNDRLEEEINKRTKELREAYKDLDTFFYKSAHDFRGPVSTFLGLSAIAKNALKDEYALMLFDKVYATAKKLEAMVRKLNAISLITSVSYQKEFFDLKNTVSEVLEKFNAEIASNNIKLSVHFEQGNYEIQSIRELMILVLENIIENALFFAKMDQAEVVINAQTDNNFIILKIDDNGDGIAQEIKDQIFQLYYRAHEASNGNGLGLYIVKKAARIIGITIKVENNSSGGASFILNIPINSNITLEGKNQLPA